MGSVSKRKLYPINDWKAFLNEGKEEFEKLIELKNSSAIGRSDILFIRMIGEGAFGKVMLAKLKNGTKLYAIKAQEKEKIIKSNLTKYVLNEKKILQALNHPFTVYLEFSFQDNVYLFLTLPFIEGGEMFTLLRKMRMFPEDQSRFYAAQVVLALEYLHHCQMVYRDLKPENLLIDHRGYLKLTDFGFCKVVPGRTYTFCGTPEYLAPEIVLSKGYGKAVDWWTFGVLVFEMNAGYPPFHSKETMRIYQNIVSKKFTIPKKFSSELENLVSNVLQVDLTRRFGNLKDGIDDIKRHDWFKHINWIDLANRKIKVPFKPEIGIDKLDLKNFGKFKEISLRTRTFDPYTKEFEDF